jgi:hypothetical protein
MADFTEHRNNFSAWDWVRVRWRGQWVKAQVLVIYPDKASVRIERHGTIRNVIVWDPSNLLSPCPKPAPEISSPSDDQPSLFS